MPMYKKRRTTYKRKSKASKRSYAMVPRPRINGELAHRHIVTCSSSTGTGAGSIRLGQTAGLMQWNIGAGYSPNMAISWSLANMVIGIAGVPLLTIPIPNVAELQQLYDTFQIEKVEVTVFFGNTESLVSNDANLGARFVLPLIVYAPDTDDASNTGITQLQQYSTCRTHQSSEPLRTSLVPCPAGGVFDPTVPTVPLNFGFTRLQRQDINVAYADTPHYGLKMSVDGFLSNPPDAFINTFVSVVSRVHFLMKNTR